MIYLENIFIKKIYSTVLEKAGELIGQQNDTWTANSITYAYINIYIYLHLIKFNICNFFIYIK